MLRRGVPSGFLLSRRRYGPWPRQGHRQRWKVWKLTRPGALVVSREGLGLASPRYTPSDKRRLSLDLGERVHPPERVLLDRDRRRDIEAECSGLAAAARRPGARPQRARPARCSAERRRRTGHRRPAAIPSSAGGGVRRTARPPRADSEMAVQWPMSRSLGRTAENTSTGFPKLCIFDMRRGPDPSGRNTLPQFDLLGATL